MPIARDYIFRECFIEQLDSIGMSTTLTLGRLTAALDALVSGASIPKLKLGLFILNVFLLWWFCSDIITPREAPPTIGLGSRYQPTLHVSRRCEFISSFPVAV